MSETGDAARPAAKTRDRSIEARRAARRMRYEREKRIVDGLNGGVPIAGIAAACDVREKHMRAVVRAILARRIPAPPEEFAAIQVGRLHDALNFAYGAMAKNNFRGADLLVRTIRELDRYHGFGAAKPRSRRPSRLDAPVSPFAIEAPRVDRRQLAPQVLEDLEICALGRIGLGRLGSSG